MLKNTQRIWRLTRLKSLKVDDNDDDDDDDDDDDIVEYFNGTHTLTNLRDATMVSLNDRDKSMRKLLISVLHRQALELL